LKFSIATTLKTPITKPTTTPPKITIAKRYIGQMI